MLFSFLVCAGNQPPANAEKPAAVGQLWGFDGHSYVFKVPQGTTFRCQNADIQLGREVAFEYVIESTDIVSYWVPSKSYVQKPEEARAPRRNFMVVSWQAYTAAHASDLARI